MRRAHHPQVAGGRDVKLQPALLGRPQPAGLQQEEVGLSGNIQSEDYNRDVWTVGGADWTGKLKTVKTVI